MANMIEHFATSKQQPIIGTALPDFKTTSDMESFFRQHAVSHSSLAEPSYGDYKLPWLNF